MSRRNAVGAVVIALGLALGLSPNALADQYTDADTEFIGGVSGGVHKSDDHGAGVELSTLHSTPLSFAKAEEEGAENSTSSLPVGEL
jgi:hypothetical protein